MQSLVVVADDLAAVRSNRFALRQVACFRVIATVDGRASVRPTIARLQPNVVLVNDMCQRMNLMSRIREAAEAAPGATVVYLAGRVDDAAVDEAVDAGAHAVIARDLPPSVLGTVLREVVLGNVAMSPRVRAERAADGRQVQLALVARTSA